MPLPGRGDGNMPSTNGGIICYKNDVNSIIDLSKKFTFVLILHARLWLGKELIIHCRLEFGLKQIYLNKFISFFIHSNQV